MGPLPRGNEALQQGTNFGLCPFLRRKRLKPASLRAYRSGTPPQGLALDAVITRAELQYPQDSTSCRIDTSSRPDCLGDG